MALVVESVEWQRTQSGVSLLEGSSWQRLSGKLASSYQRWLNALIERELRARDHWRKKSSRRADSEPAEKSEWGTLVAVIQLPRLYSIHVEIQGQVNRGFGKRMFRYNFRCFDLYDRRALSMAMLTDVRALLG